MPGRCDSMIPTTRLDHGEWIPYPIRRLGLSTASSRIATVRDTRVTCVSRSHSHHI